MLFLTSSFNSILIPFLNSIPSYNLSSHSFKMAEQLESRTKEHPPCFLPLLLPLSSKSWIKIPEVKINLQKTETLLFCIKWHKKHNNYNGERSIIKILILLEIELINPRLFIETTVINSACFSAKYMLFYSTASRSPK